MMHRLLLLLLLLLCMPFSKVMGQATVINKKGTVVSVDTSKWKLNGLDIYSKNSGNVGIGNSSPAYKLDITGKLRVTDSAIAGSLRLTGFTAGTTSDSIVVSDPTTGLLKRVSPSRYTAALVTASNGLSMSGTDVQLGGALTSPTTLATSSTNTLSMTGLSAGSLSSDSVMLVTATGILKRASFIFPEVQVVASRTITYTTATIYTNLIYNSASVNLNGVYNTTTGTYTAPATGVYEVIVNNMYNTSVAANSEIRNRIIANGLTDQETSITLAPYSGGTVNNTIRMSTIVTLNASQTISIQVGGLLGTVNPTIGTGQHVMKIIRLK